MYAVVILCFVVSVTSLPVLNTENNTTDPSSSTIIPVNDVTKMESFISDSVNSTINITMDNSNEPNSKELHEESGDTHLYTNEDIHHEKENQTVACQQSTSENSTKINCIKYQPDKEIKSINNTTNIIKSNTTVGGGVDAVNFTTTLPLIFSESEELITTTISNNETLGVEITNSTLFDVQQKEAKPANELIISSALPAPDTEKDKIEVTSTQLPTSNCDQKQQILHEKIISSPLNKFNSKHELNKDEVISKHMKSTDKKHTEKKPKENTSSPLPISEINQDFTTLELKKPSKLKVKPNTHQRKNNSKRKHEEKTTSLKSILVNQENKQTLDDLHRQEHQKKENIISSSAFKTQQKLSKQREPINFNPLYFDGQQNWKNFGGISPRLAAFDIRPNLDEVVDTCGGEGPYPFLNFPEPPYLYQIMFPPFPIDFPPNVWPYVDQIFF